MVVKVLKIILLALKCILSAKMGFKVISKLEKFAKFEPLFEEKIIVYHLKLYFSTSYVSINQFDLELGLRITSLKRRLYELLPCLINP